MMDAFEFFKARKRMCEATKCASCKLGHMQGGCCIDPETEKIDACEEAIAIVEQWAADHPIKTRQSVFLEQYPETRLSEDGILLICPRMISAEYRGEDDSCNRVNYGTCADCRREFWSAEVEE